MTAEEIIGVIIVGIVFFVVVYFIVFMFWWNHMERKKDKIMMRYQERQREILMKILSKEDEKDA